MPRSACAFVKRIGSSSRQLPASSAKSCRITPGTFSWLLWTPGDELKDDRTDKQKRLLDEAVEGTCGVPGTWLRSLDVTLLDSDETVWDGLVHVYSLYNHPDADACYVWSQENGEEIARIYVVLRIHPVVSAETAVKAAIVADYRAGRTP